MSDWTNEVAKAELRALKRRIKIGWQRQAGEGRTEEMANVADLSRIYAKLHETRFEHVTRARRERELETRVYELERLLRAARDRLVHCDWPMDERVMVEIAAALRTALNAGG